MRISERNNYAGTKASEEAGGGAPGVRAEKTMAMQVVALQPVEVPMLE